MKTSMNDDMRTVVKSADRVLDLFELLARRSNGLSHAALADALEIPKSSLTQLLKTVSGRGYVNYSAEDKHYRLGGRFASMARLTSRSLDLITQAQPILEEVTDKTRESSALNVIKGQQAEVVATVSSTQRLVSHMRLGDLAPLYATSGGKIMLANLPEAQREDYINSVQFEAITANTVTSKAQLRKQLDLARREGVAFSFEEFTPGIIGLAKAVLTEEGEPLGSINVAMPAVRFSEQLKELIITVLTQAEKELEKRVRV
jgi:DNA-binding IclR family transcriptional regulator